MDITSLKSGIEYPADKKLGDVLFACQMKSSHNIRVKLLEERPDFITEYQLKRSNSNESHESFRSDNTLVDNNDDEKRRFLPQDSSSSMIHSYYKTGVLQQTWTQTSNTWSSTVKTLKEEAMTRISKDEKVFDYLLPGQCMVSDPPMCISGDDSKGKDYWIVIENESCNTSDIPVTLTFSDIDTLFSSAPAILEAANCQVCSSRGPIICDKKIFHGLISKTQSAEFNLDKEFPIESWDIEELVRDRASNLPFKTDLFVGGSEITKFNHPMVLLSLLTLLYGAGFATAWNAHFSTSVERDLWRLACAASALPSITCIGARIWQLMFCRGQSRHAEVNEIARGFAWVFLVPFFCGRAFLIVESFISIRNSPPGAYETTRWTEVWPHL